MNPKYFLPILVALLLTGSAQAQYTGDNQTNTISGFALDWTANGAYYVGQNWVNDALMIQAGGVLSNTLGYIGYQSGASNNTVLVSDSGSVWSNTSDLTVGYSGAANSLTIASGGTVYNAFGYIGYQSGASNNTVLVSDGGSVWSNTSDLTVGYSGAANSLTIAGSGSVYNAFGYIGFVSANNTVLVTDNGSLWRSTNDLYVGFAGVLNSLTITNGSAVRTDGYGYIGYEFSGIGNTVLVTGSGSVWSNGGLLAVGNVGANNSLTIASGGSVYNGTSYIGEQVGANNNAVLVTGSGSVWSNANSLEVGVGGAGNSLTIVGSGAVYNSYGYIGTQSNANGNTVLVTGSGSVWSNANDLTVGYSGPDNSLTIASSGTVYNAFTYIGYLSGANDNTILVSDPGSVWSNANSLFVGYNSVGNLLMVTNGGAVFTGQYGIIGNNANAHNNTVLVAGNGSVWSIALDLYVGAEGGTNSLTINNGGKVITSEVGVIGSDSDGNTVLIRDSNSVWSASYFIMGGSGSGNSLTITNGGAVLNSGTGLISDLSDANNNTVLVTGSGSVWSNADLIVGYYGVDNTLTIAANGSVIASNTFIGSYYSSGSTVSILGGSLCSQNSLGNGVLEIDNGTLALNSGTVTVNKLVLTNGLNSNFIFTAGMLNSGGTYVSTPQAFTVGDGANTAVFHLLGGEHTFVNGPLEIQNNALLTGCGTINGNVVIDAGGAVVADCGGTFTFTGSVTNNGSIVATNGTFINFYGPVINNGQIGPTNSVRFYPFVPSVGVTNSWLGPTGDKWERGFNWSAGAPSILQPALYITNASSKTVTIDFGTTLTFTNTLTISNLTVSGPSGSTNTLLLESLGANIPLQIISNLTVNAGGIVSVTNSIVLVDSAGSLPGFLGLFVGVNSAGEQLNIGGGYVSDNLAFIGCKPSSSNNAVLVTGSGSVWSNGSLSVGFAGTSNSLTISSNGMAYSINGSIGGLSNANNNTVLVTGSGSVWSGGNQLNVGADGAGNSLTIASSGSVSSTFGIIGLDTDANYNSALITGSGSLWSNITLSVGYFGSGNSLTISNAGAVYDAVSYIGTVSNANNNSALVTGSGSVWSNASALVIGDSGSGNSLTILSSGNVNSANGYIGFGYGASNNSVLVTGSGSVWQNDDTLYLGDGGSSNTLTIADGLVMAGNAFVGFSSGSGIGSNNVLLVDSGGLLVTNAQGNGALVVSPGGGQGNLILNGGSVTANQLVLTNGANSVLTFNAGTLDSGETLMSTPQNFTVGDGTNAAVFHLSGGVHSFVNGSLEIQDHALLTGCAMINGNVMVDAGGKVLADCGGTLTFTGSVTNNGSIVATNGTIINFYGPVVNNGQIGPTNSVHFYFVPSIGATNSWISSTGDKWESGIYWSAGPPSIIQPAVYITNASSKTVTMDTSTTVFFPYTLTISNLTVSSSSGSTNTLLLNSMGAVTPLQIVSNLTVNTGGIVAITNSTLEVDSSGTVPGTNGLFIGVNSAGEHVSIQGGQIADDFAYIGYNQPSSNNTVLVTGSGSVWSNVDLSVGYNGADNLLTIASSGTVYDAFGIIGNLSNANNNAVLVAGSGSVWSNNLLFVGDSGAGNSLTVSNAGAVYNGNSFIGTGSNANNNTVLVTGSGSVWSGGNQIDIGSAGVGNALTIASSGTVYNAACLIGAGYGANDNSVLVTGSGSVWSNNLLYVGYSGTGNSLTISNGGAVWAAVYGNSYIGEISGANSNTVLVTGNGSVWSTGYGGLYVGNAGVANSLTIASSGTVYDGYGYIGEISGANSNSVVVSGSGSVWSNADYLYVGDYGMGNSLTIASSGTVYSTYGGYIGNQPGANDNTVLVTGSGSVWSIPYFLYVGVNGVGNSLTISNGGTLYSGYCYIGYSSGGGSNTVLVTGSGSIWQNENALYVGYGSSSNALRIAGGSVVAGNAFVGYWGIGSNNVLRVDSGSLVVTNAQGNSALVVSPGGGTGSLILNGGSVTVNQLVLTNGVNSVLAFNAGTLDSGETLVSTPQKFTVGDGADTAVFHLSGGAHIFLNGALEIQNHAVLTGCGSIYGTLQVDAGGRILADCGNTLNITGSVTNNGSIVATNGTVINFYGPVVNNGQIGPTNSVHYYSIVASTGGTNSWINPASDKWENGLNWSAGPPSIIQPAVYITNAANKTVTLDIGTGLAFTNTLTISNLTVSGPSGSTNTLWLNSMGANTSLQILSNLTVNAGGILAATNSTLEVDNSGTIPEGVGLFIGVSSAGAHLSIRGGQVSDDDAYLGYNSSSSNNSVLVTGSGSVWSNAYGLNVGLESAGNSLTITNAAVVTDGGDDSIGLYSSATSNTVLVTGSGSVWSSTGGLVVGNSGADNSLTISNGALVTGGSDGGIIGLGNTANSNTVLVTGNGSVWSNQDVLFVGLYGSGNSLTIASSGTVYDSYAEIGSRPFASSNTVLVTGSGSVWSNASGLVVGDDGVGNSLTISNGAVVFSGGGDDSIGLDSGANSNTVLVTGYGSVWDISGTLYIGWPGSSNQLIIGTGGTVIASNAVIGLDQYGFLLASNNVLQVNGGSLFVTNSYGSAQLSVGQSTGKGSLILNSGTVTVNLLIVTNGANGVFTFNSGTLTSGGTFITNNLVFVVGDGTDAATFHLSGGVHTFANNLEIANHATLTGCGTINGNVLVDSGGTVLATCGSPLTFNGSVTNNGTMRAINGSTLEVWGTVVNNGTIDVINGARNFYGTVINNGTILDASSVKISQVSKSGQNIVIQIPSVVGHTYQLQVTPSMKPTNWSNTGSSQTGTAVVLTFTDVGGATNSPTRFYRVDCTAP